MQEVVRQFRQTADKVDPSLRETPAERLAVNLYNEGVASLEMGQTSGAIDFLASALSLLPFTSVDFRSEHIEDFTSTEKVRTAPAQMPRGKCPNPTLKLTYSDSD